MKSTLCRASWVAKVFSPAIWVMALWVVLGGGGQPAYATHFRYGHINWAPVSGNTVQFTDTNAHINNADGGYRVETVVNVGTGNSSPVTALPPIILCPINALCSFRVPGADPNGDPLRFRLSTAPEASSDAPTPPPPP